MTKEKKKQRGIGSFASKILIAAVLISMLTVTASAAEYVQNWFRTYFSNQSETPLSEKQVEFIDENVQDVSQSQTYDGCTVKVKSAITDGRTAYITLGMTAPEDIALNATNIEGYDPAAPQILFNVESGKDVFLDANGKYISGSQSYSWQEDNDGLANTQDILFILEKQDVDGEFAFGSDVAWKLCIEDIALQYRNTAFIDEWRAANEAGRDNYLMDEEERLQKMYPQVTLAEGDWNFDIRFENSDLREIELITEPVTAKVVIGWKEDGSDVYGELPIQSFKLRSLGATLTCDYEGAPDFTDHEGKIYAVMKDGSREPLCSSLGFPGVQEFLAVSPIVLDDVDYILLGDGTRLPMPALSAE